MSQPNISDICASIEKILRQKLFHPRIRGKALDELITGVISDCKKSSPDSVTRHINQSLKALGVSNTAFWAPPARALSAPWALNATLRMFLDDTREVWMFKDVLSGGVAFRAGIAAGDELIAVNGIPVTSEPRFQLGQAYTLTIRAVAGGSKDISLQLPAGGKANRPPMVEPEALSSSLIRPGVGLLRVSAFPAIVGFDFARQLTSIAEMFRREKCSRLIVDLRGNCGGGIGSLRLMSLLTPGKLEVGYSLSRSDLDHDPASLPTINKIPQTKFGLFLMALRFKVFHRGRSLKLVTEGLGKQPFQGPESVVILADESSRSGAEMVAAFAQKNRLARIIGEHTAGETLGAANFKIQEAYRLRIPLVGWFLPDGEMLEQKGVQPDQVVAPTLQGLRSGKDEVMNAALAILA